MLGQDLLALVAEDLGEDLAKLVLTHGRQPVESSESLSLISAYALTLC